VGRAMHQLRYVKSNEKVAEQAGRMHLPLRTSKQNNDALLILPDAPYTNDSSSLSTSIYVDTGLNQYHAGGVRNLTLQRCCCRSITPPLGPLWENMTSSIQPEVHYVFCNPTRGGPSHGDRQPVDINW